MTNDLTKLPGDNARSLSHGWPDEMRVRALSLIAMHSTISAAHRALVKECAAQGQDAPAYHTVWEWAREGDVIPLTYQHRKPAIELAADVMYDLAERLTAKRDELTPYQTLVGYGIASDKLSGLLNASKGSGGGGVNVQINVTNQEGQPVFEGGGRGKVVEGEVVQD